MYYPVTYPRSITWLPALRTWASQWLARLTPPPAQQIQLPAGDIYHLDAGSYCLRVLAGSVWLPEIGIFAAGEQITLTLGAAGLAMHSYRNPPAVLAVRSRG